MKKENFNYLSMAQASKICPYEQEYLSLLARRKQLKAVKIDGKWMTTVEWLNEYLRKMKPDHIIASSSEVEKDTVKISAEIPMKKNIFFGWVGAITLAIILILISVWGVYRKFENIEKNSSNGQFVPEEILRVPDEKGDYDVYEYGKRKVGTEETKEDVSSGWRE